jgi:Spy/CpxP family protein refolding chaperone
LALVPAIAFGAGMNIDAAVDRLDKLVSLTVDQRIQVAGIYANALDALKAFPSQEERMNKGVPIRQQARAQIRALLTPAQQKIYDITPLRLGGGTLLDINAAVERLDTLVNLTTDQAVQAAAIFTLQNDAMEAFPTLEDRIMKGMDVRQDTRAQIRAILTPEQQQIYNTTPVRLGGGSLLDPAAIESRIDKVVTLTDDQIAPVAAIYQKAIDTFRALSADDRANGEAAAIQKSAQAQVRALLTPEQQQKFDANPTGSEDLAERAFVSVFLRTAPAVTARVGAATRVVQTGYLVHLAGLKAMKGNYVFYVQGSAGAAKFKVYWEKSPFAPIKIVKIEDFVGGIIPP